MSAEEIKLEKNVFDIFEDDFEIVGNDSVFLIKDDDNSNFIDLGLPSGRLWMKHLVGMKTDADIQNALYFQWGSEKGYRGRERLKFISENCDFSKTYWDLFGDGVKLPSKDDFKELLDNTEHHVETINGVNGMRFVSKSNGNSIFVPFIGFRVGSDVSNVGDYVSLWSSSLCVSYPGSAVSLNASSLGYASVGNDYRYYGYGVLGVI